ncbi:MAG: sensor histidine kinase [Eubacterium sp.]|nr:sensor histidine kinase [Eubacterium sp.]
MSGKQYLKNKLPMILLNLLSMITLAVFLSVIDVGIQSILFITLVWTFVMICYLIIVYSSHKKYLAKLLHMTEQLDERYLIAEIMETPDNAEERVFYQIMKMGEKSMLEKIARIEEERREYKEYIEQWIHEAKTPITAMKLLCENNRCDFTRELLIELEHMNRFTEQALYYARSEHAEKDYRIRETELEKVVHDAIADNKYLLRQNGVAVIVDDMHQHVYTDEKWVRFILDQIIANAVKYRGRQPQMHFYTKEKADQVELAIADNGIGIPAGDLPRIFEKGFTGENGRLVQGSTGIGLYLCRRLCDKLGIGLCASSEGAGTTIVLSFHINDFVAEVQG